MDFMELEGFSMPVPQPARYPLGDDFSHSDDIYLRERFELISKKYAGGLDQQQTTRLAEIEDYLDRQDLEKADMIDVRGQERMGRIAATLDRVERAILDLQTLKLQ
jgi:hypothetical protein